MNKENVYIRVNVTLFVIMELYIATNLVVKRILVN